MTDAPRPPAPSYAFYHAIRLLSRPVFGAMFRLTREGLAALPGEGPLILAANHVSYLDPAVVGSTFPRAVRFLIHESVYAKPGQTWFYRAMRSIPVAREGGVARAALREAMQSLRQGAVVGIFPEGGRVEPGAVDPALVGVALLARRSGVPVVPVGIAGTEKAMPRGVALPRPVRVVVRYGEPVLYDKGDEGGRSADQAFTEELMKRIRQLAGLAEAGP